MNTWNGWELFGDWEQGNDEDAGSVEKINREIFPGGDRGNGSVPIPEADSIGSQPG